MLHFLPFVGFSQCNKVYTFTTRKPKFKLEEDSLIYYKQRILNRIFLNYFSPKRRLNGPSPRRISCVLTLLVDTKGVVQELDFKEINLRFGGELIQSNFDDKLKQSIRAVYLNRKLFSPGKYFNKEVCSIYEIRFLLIVK